MFGYFESRFKHAQLTRPENCGAGFVRDENDELVIARTLMGLVGRVIELHDTGYDAAYPTGEEPIEACVEFNGKRIWVEEDALTFF